MRILSGVFEGKTTGTPIGLLVDNVDQRSRDYEKTKERFRPGHADYTYQQKYGFAIIAAADAPRRARPSCGWRPEPSPANTCESGCKSVFRDTWRKWVPSCCSRWIPQVRMTIRFSARIPAASKQLEELIWNLREAGDSIGARVTVIAKGVPPGWGEPVFERLDADLASA